MRGFQRDQPVRSVKAATSLILNPLRARLEVLSHRRSQPSLLYHISMLSKMQCCDQINIKASEKDNMVLLGTNNMVVLDTRKIPWLLENMTPGNQQFFFWLLASKKELLATKKNNFTTLLPPPPKNLLATKKRKMVANWLLKLVAGDQKNISVASRRPKNFFRGEPCLCTGI